MVSHPENGSDSPIRSDRDRGRDKEFKVNGQILKHYLSREKEKK